MQEAAIIKACKNKDRAGQHAFVQKYSVLIFKICKRYMTDESQAKDALQESLIQILHKIDRYSDLGSFEGWIRRVTVYKCLELIRKEKKHRGFEIDPMSEPIVEEKASLHLEQEEVLAFLKQMPDNYRIAINMFLVEGYSHKEISDHLGISTSSSRSLVSRGRKIIADAFRSESMQIVFKKKEPIVLVKIAHSK